MIAFTIVAQNYLAAARVLAESFLRFHPDSQFTVVLLDDEVGEIDSGDGSFTIMRIEEVAFEPDQLEQMFLIYDVMELATAVKPWVFRHLLAAGAEEVLYFDPDIQIFARLDDLAALARRHAVVLTPHSTEPFPRDRKRVTEADILGSGVYNLGFLALSNDSRRFLDWWAERLLRDCISDPQRMMFTDQRWIDFVPGFFPHTILRDTTVNVAYWNLHARRLTGAHGSYTVDGKPLRFFHFSGFDPDVPYVLSKHMTDRPRILLSQNPALASICAEYGDLLLQSGHRQWRIKQYGRNTLPGGFPLDRRMRRLYRTALVESEQQGKASPPNPYVAGTEAFIAWLNQPIIPRRGRPISHYALALYAERPDLQAAFPDLAGPGGDAYVDWLCRCGCVEERLPDQLVPQQADIQTETAQSPAAEPTAVGEGVNVAGYFRAELGVGEAARSLLAGIEAAEIPYSTLSYREAPSRQNHPFEDQGPGEAPYDISIICVNADITPVFARTAGAEFFTNRYTIGFWFWETEDFPSSMLPAFDYVDEVWVASEHIRKALLAVSPRPVTTIPLPVSPPSYSKTITRGDLGVPAGFLFLFSFDFFSIMERKNPLGLVNAFSRSFPPGSGAHLVIKTINGDKRLAELERLRMAAAHHPDIIVLDGYLTSDEKSALAALCDCYVSLHRAEGFGLTMSEAMSLGKPVIATGYSGNMDFMDEENAYLVPFLMRRVGPGREPYLADGLWADPDLDAAARLMLHVFEHQDEAMAKGLAGQRTILSQRTPLAAARVISERLDQIRASNAPEPVTESAPPSVVTLAASAADDSLQLALALYNKPLDVDSPTRRGGPWRAAVRFGRRAVYRLLRNYQHDQREAGVALATHVMEMERRNREQFERLIGEVQRLAHTLDSYVGPELNRLVQTELDLSSRAVQMPETLSSTEKQIREGEARAAQVSAEMETRLDQGFVRAMMAATEVETRLDDTVTQLQQQIEQWLTAMEAARINLADQTQESLSGIEARLQGAEARIGQAPAEIETRLGETVTQLQQQMEQSLGVVESVRADVAGIEAAMQAVPYMADPTLLSLADETGREVIGYQGHRHAADAGQSDPYLGFENIFRGDERLIRDRQRLYVPLLESHCPVVDIGCGRGEMLDLLAQAGIPGLGVDPNQQMVDHCRAKGHRIVQDDAISFLAGRDDASLGAIFSAQVIEHLQYEELLQFLHLARRKLMPGGVLIAETVNPHSYRAMKTFWVDLTHQKPIFPEVLAALCQLEGFSSARVVFPLGTGQLEADRRTEGEYAIVAVTEPRLNRDEDPTHDLPGVAR